MDNLTGHKPLALEPLDVPTSNSDLSTRAPQSQLRVTAADEFLAQAAKEHQGGHVDPALWARTSARAGDDGALAVAAYLRARATALQLRKRNEGEAARVLEPIASGVATIPQPESAKRPEVASPRAAGGSRRKLTCAVASVALAALVAVAWWLAAPREASPPQPALAVAPETNVPSPKSLAPAQPVNVASAAASQPGVDESLEMKVQDLKKAGNWNVLVLYAAAWTRKEPGNAVAWTELSMGYAKMRQWGDALEAARKAIQLSPEDARHWRDLGQVMLAVEHLSEARFAFDKVLGVDADDADALCGAALVAKGERRAKDVDALAARMKSIGVNCDGLSEVTSTAAVARGAPVRDPVTPRRQ